MIQPITKCLLFAFLLGNITPLFAENLNPSDTLSGEHLNQRLIGLKSKDAFLFNDLKRGQLYQFTFSVTEANACLPKLNIDFEHERFRETSWQVIIQFTATKATERVEIDKDCIDGMPNDYFVASKCLDCPEKEGVARSLAVIQTEKNADANYLIKDVFLGGGCFEVENVTSKGPENSRGTFTQGMTSIDMEDGVILATGNVRNAIGPNDDASAGNPFTGFNFNGDSDLRKLLPAGSASVKDVAIIEFDFTPTIDEVSFEYVFASEEYCEYVGKQFNDVFGFFISGPGINGPFSNNAINIAVLPGTSDYVSINSVNFSSNSNYYHDNVPGFTALTGGCKFGEIFNGTKARKDIQYDGFTHILKAVANVIPCETYHIKLAIGDVGDQIYDSAVFLKAGSFNAGGTAQLSVNVPSAPNPLSGQAIEGCQESFLLFERAEGDDINEELVVNFTISDSSTATKDFDYILPNSPIIIPAGVQSVEVPFEVIEDPFEEEDETIIFVLENPCSCEGKETQLIITEPKPFEVALANTTTCPGGTVNLTPIVDSTHKDLNYIWNTGDSLATLTQVINEPTSFTVTITDACGVEVEAQSEITFSEQEAVLSGAINECNGEREGQIEVSFTGTGPYTLNYTVNGDDQTISNITNNQFVLPAAVAGEYEAISMMSEGCEGKGIGKANYTVSEVDFGFDFAPPKCFDSKDGFIDVAIDAGNYAYDWNTGATTSKIENLEGGIYTVEVIDELGCAKRKEIELKTPKELTAKIEALGIANCYNPNGGRINLEVEGGSPGYLFSWNNGLGNMQNPNNLEDGIYKVNIKDAFGCETEASVEILSDLATPTVETAPTSLITCLESELELKATVTSSEPDLKYNWTTLEGNIIRNGNTLTPTINAPGVYTLEVTNNDNGCMTKVDLNAEADLLKPDLEISSAGILNCKHEKQTLKGVINNQIADYDVTWTTIGGNILTATDALQLEVDAIGTYQLEVVNKENGCTNTINFEMIEDRQKPDFTINEPLALTCERKAVSLKTEMNNMEEMEYEFDWESNDGHFLENRNTLNPSVDKEGTYMLTVRNSTNFCEASKMATVLLDTVVPKADAGEPFVFTCSLTSIQLNGSVAEEGDYDYEWTTVEGNILGGAKSASPLINKAGTYVFAVLNKENGCSATDEVVLEDDANRPKVLIEQPDNITCSNSTITLNANNSSKGDNLTYTWATEDGILFNPANPIFPVISSGGVYELIIVDVFNDCKASAKIEVGYDTISPIANLNAPEIFNCKKNEVQIDASNSSTGLEYLFSWQTTDGNIISKPDIVSPMVNAAGTYQLEITNIQNGCRTLSSLTIREEKPEALELEVKHPLCYGEKGQTNILNVIGGVGPYTYSIDGGNNFYADPRFGQLTPGFYNVQVKDANDCSMEEVIQITQPDELMLDLGTQKELGLGDSVQIQVNTNISQSQLAEIIWSPATGLSCDDCMNPIAKPFLSQKYDVQIMDQNGCQATASLSLLVDQTPQIFVPNVFRPFNSEGLNDRFTIFAKQGLVQNIQSFEIYNRWGETVFLRENFTPNDPAMGWDGMFGRKKMRPAVFVYRADVELVGGRKIQLKGDFTLME
jgi:hypothetical protein